MEYSDFFQNLLPYLPDNLQSIEFLKELQVVWIDHDWTPAFLTERAFSEITKFEVDTSEQLKLLNLEETKVLQGHLIRRYSDDTFVITRYSVENTLLISTEKFASQQVWCFEAPFLLVYTADHVLQCFDVRNNVVTKFPDTSQDHSQSQQMIYEPMSNQIFVVSSTKIKIWKLTELSKRRHTTSEEPQQTPPLEPSVSLSFVREINIRATMVTFLQRITFFQFCGDPKYVLAASRETFQLWNVETESLVFEGKCTSTSAIESFTAITCWSHYVVLATSKNEIRLYNIKPSGSESFNPIVFRDRGLVAKLTMDERFILVGDISGAITVIDWKNYTGFMLNQVTDSFELSPASARSNQAAATRINFLERFDRWVISGTLESLSIWDILKPQSNKPVFSHSFTSSTLRYLVCDPQEGAISMVVKAKSSDQNQIALLAWSPMPWNLSALVGLPTDLFNSMNSLPPLTIAGKQRASLKHYRSSSNVT